MRRKTRKRRLSSRCVKTDFQASIYPAANRAFLAFHALLQIGRCIAHQIFAQAHLLEALGIHEHIHITILVEIAVGYGFHEGALHGIGCLVTHGGFHAIGNAAHVDGGGGCSLAGVHAFGFQHDIELAIFMFNDVALANAACNNFNHWE